MFLNENMKFLFDNKIYLLPKLYLDIFFNLKIHFPVLTLSISLCFFLSHFSYPWLFSVMNCLI